MSPSELESKKQFAIDRIDCLNQLQIFPPRSRLDPEAWLNNFYDSEIPYALILLRGFIFFNASTTTKLFAGSINNLVGHVVSNTNPPNIQFREWESFFRSALFTRIQGELPSEADSGFIFLRLIRDLYRIPENHIVSPQEAFNNAASNENVNVVFVDDFIGSGHQMLEQLLYPYAANKPATFKDLASASTRKRLYCCTAICAEPGYDLLKQECPELTVISQHRMSNRYNVKSPEFFIPHELSDFTHTIEEISLRAGIERGSIWGHGELGFTLGFDHGIPDSTIPLLAHRTEHWHPLIMPH